MKPGVYFHSITDMSSDLLKALGITYLSQSTRYLVITMNPHGSFVVNTAHSVADKALPMSLDQVKELALTRQLEM